MKGRIICVMVILRTVECGPALKQNVVTVDDEVYVLEGNLFRVGIAVVYDMACQLPFAKIR